VLDSLKTFVGIKLRYQSNCANKMCAKHNANGTILILCIGSECKAVEDTVLNLLPRTPKYYL